MRFRCELRRHSGANTLHLSFVSSVTWAGKGKEMRIDRPFLKNILRKPQVICRMIKQRKEPAYDSIKYHCQCRDGHVLLCIAALSCSLWWQGARCSPDACRWSFWSETLYAPELILGSLGPNKAKIDRFQRIYPLSLIVGSQLAQVHNDVEDGSESTWLFAGLWKIEDGSTLSILRMLDVSSGNAVGHLENTSLLW